MTVYVLGAGVSKGVGYPLGGELFEAVEKHVRNGFEGAALLRQWRRLRRWFREVATRW